MQPRFFAVAEVGAPHGLSGEVGLVILTDFPERLRPGDTYTLSPPLPGRTEVRLDGIRGQARLLAHFEGIDTAEAARDLAGRRLLVPEEAAVKLDEGSYWIDDLLGCSVATQEGERLGVLEEVVRTGANDVYMVRLPDGRMLPLPATADAILSVDVGAKTMVVRLMPGLMELAT